MTNKRARILIIDDTVEIIKILMGILKSNYDTTFAKSGASGLELAKTQKPDLILLDIIMPDLSGYEVCKKLKEEEATKDIPVIFVTAVSEAMDLAKGFEAGGVDYVTKPFIPEIIKARVATHLRLKNSILELKALYNMALDANPLTGMAGNNSIAMNIKKMLSQKLPIAVAYLDIDNFKSFNDKYGFARGDEVLLFTAEILKETKVKFHDKVRFIGHIGGDDFVLVLEPEHAEDIGMYVTGQFKSRIGDFYNEEDRKKNAITATSRRGELLEYPIMSISLGGIAVDIERDCEYLEIIDQCIEQKQIAKGIVGNSVVIK